MTPEPRTGAPPPALAELSVIVVTWSSAAEVPALVASLQPALAAGAELVVIENGSGDATPALVRAAAPTARILVNECNRGFAAAANQGIRATHRPFVLLLNPDVVVDPDTLPRALAFAAADSTIGVVGVRTCGSDGRVQRTVDRLHTPGGLAWAALRARPFGSREHGEAPPATTDVEWLYGSFLLCRRSVLDAVHGFDEGYFMYGEDRDLCRRVRDAGGRVVYFTGASIVHHGNRSGARRYGEERDVVALGGTLRYFRVHHGRVGAGAFRVLAGTSFVVKALVWRVRGWITGDAAAVARGRLYGRLAGRCADPEHAARPLAADAVAAPREE